MRYPRARKRALIALALAAGIVPSRAHATDKYYVGPANGTGNWSTSANWSLTQGGAGGAGAPVAGDFLYIRHFDTANRTINYDVNITNSPFLTRIRMGNSSGVGVTTLTQTSNFSMTVIGEAVGSTGTISSGSGVHTQSAGLNTYTSFLSLGDDPGTGTGTYNLSGTGSMILNNSSALSDPGLYVGTAENGVFNQNGGTVAVGTTSVPVPLYVGWASTGVGTYNLSAGSLSAFGGEQLGFNGIGTFNQTGGTNIVGTAAAPSALIITNSSTATGNYLLSGASTLKVNGYEDVGHSAAGTFNQSGGTNTLGTLYLGFVTAGSGTYLLSNSSTLTASGDEQIGSAGAGTFNQSGGANNCANLYLASNTGGKGTYLLSDTGALTTTNTEYLGYNGAGTINQTGGSNNASLLIIGSNAGLGPGVGTYLLSGSGSLNTAVEHISDGNGATGTFNQTGGTNNTGHMQIGAMTGSTGTYLLSGSGVLSSSQEIVVGAGGVGTFNQNGGTVSANSVFIGDDPTVSTLTTGTYVLQTGALNVASFLIVGSDAGNGTFNQSGGTTTTDVLYIGEGPGSTGNFLLSGGTLTVTGQELLADSGSGTFTQSGGTQVIGSPSTPANLSVGDVHTGRFFLSGPSALTLWGDLYVGIASGGFFGQSGGVATLNADAYVGGDNVNKKGQASLNISDGSMSIAGTLTIWNLDLDAVNLSNGYLAVGSINTDGGPSRFNWTGGTFAITRGLTIGPGGGLGSTANIASTFINYGVVTMAGGSTIGPGQFINQNFLTGYGSLGGSGGIVNTGLIQPTGGNLIVTNTGSFSNTGNIELAGLAQLQLNGGSLSNSGGISMANATITGTAQLNNNIDGVIYGSGNISTPFANNGLLEADPGNLTTGGFSNGGVVEMAGSAANLGGGTINNNGVIEGFGKISSAVNNFGQIKPLNGTLMFTGLFKNPSMGQIVVPSGASLLVVQPMSGPNTGVISLLGGILDTNGQTMTNGSTGTITGRGTFRSGGLTNGGSMTFSAGLTDVFGAVTNNRQITVTGGSTTTFYNAVDTSFGSISVNTNSTIVFLGNVTGQSKITGPGIKDFESTASGGPIATIVGDTLVGGPAFVTADFLHEDDVQVTGTLKISPNGTSASTSLVNTLGIFSGKLDLTNNAMIVTGTPLSTIKGYIISAYNGGSWDGNGITSTNAAAIAADSSNVHKTAVGYAMASSLNVSAFNGQSVSGSDTLIRYTFSGDANLDGNVNALDFNALASNFGGTGKLWTQGDFNDDGVINTQDFTALTANFNQVLPAPALATFVPEPSATVLFLNLILSCRKRRARKGKFRVKSLCL